MAYHLNIIFPLVIPLVQTNTVYFNDYTKNSNNDFNTTFSNIKFQVYDTILSYIRIVNTNPYQLLFNSSDNASNVIIKQLCNHCVFEITVVLLKGSNIGSLVFNKDYTICFSSESNTTTLPVDLMIIPETDSTTDSTTAINNNLVDTKLVFNYFLSRTCDNYTLTINDITFYYFNIDRIKTCQC